MSRSRMVFLLALLATYALWMDLPHACFAQWQPPEPLGSADRTAPRQPLPVQAVHASHGVDQRASHRSHDRRVSLVGAELGSSPPSLPNDHGQVWREYDISDITSQRSNSNLNGSKPEQVVVDWILRETGTDVWFGEPLGLLSANERTLRVYHTREVQAQVADIVDRFGQTDAARQAFGVRLVTLASPNWRAKAMPRMVPVSVQTPGVEAWLLSREDAAVVLEQIRKRVDFREYSSPNLLIQNGQTHLIERQRPVSYVRGMRPVPNAPGGYQMELGQISQGFSLAVSPLLSQDRSTIDAVIKLETTQIEKLTSMSLPTPTVANPRGSSQIQVPQTSSWRLHERFRWPSHQVLLISCGVIADPGPQRGGILGMTSLPGKPPRSDALLFVEAKGRFNELLAVPQTADETGLNFRGRY